MKNTILTLALLMGLSAASNVNASNGIVINKYELSYVNVKAMNDLKFVVTALNLDSKSTIEIKNDKGEILHTEYIGKTEKFSKIFDLSRLGDGSYTFVVRSNEEIIEKPFEIATKRVVTPISNN